MASEKKNSPLQVFTGNLSRESKLTPYTRADNTQSVVYHNSIAMDTGIKDKDGEKITTFIKFTLWGDRAEAFAARFQRGDTVHFAGELVPSSFEKDGVRYNSPELRVIGQLDENQAKRIQSFIKDTLWGNRPNQRQQDAVQPEGDGQDAGAEGYDMEM